MPKLLYNRAEIRTELYRVITRLRQSKAQHREAFADRHGDDNAYGSTKPCGECHVCERYDAKIDGVRFAIRQFGGKPRYV